MTERPASNEPISSAQADYDSMRYVSGEVPCPYLPGVASRSEAYAVDGLDAMFFAAGIKNNEGQIIAVLTQRVDPSNDFTRMMRLGRIGKSGET